MKKFLFSALVFFSCSYVMASETTLLLIRHGETNWNVEKRWQGQANIPLNEQGKKQAKLTAHKLLDEHPDLAGIYSSDLSRALDTALESAKLFKLPVSTSPALREFKAGAGEGLLHQEVLDRFGGWDVLMQKYPNKRERWKHSQVPGQETTYEISERLKAALYEIAIKHPDQKVAIFTHGGCIKALIADLEDLENIDHVPTPNCSIYQIIYNLESPLKPLRLVGCSLNEKKE
jgi:probable phosphoglycerate mutase